MKNMHHVTISLAVAAVLAAAAATAQAPDTRAKIGPVVAEKPQIQEHPKPRAHAAPVLPHEEPNVDSSAATAGFTAGAFSAAPATSMSPFATTLSPPVTITYAGAGKALSISDSGTGKGIVTTMTNSAGAGSAIIGTTPGSGAGIAGSNSGTTGPGGKFSVSNSSSGQSAIFATTAGTGAAVTGTITNAVSDYPAIYGYNLLTAGVGVGVEGDGNYQGVYGYSPEHFGVYGYSPAGVGILGSSSSYRGIEAYSGTDDALYASSTSGYGVYATSSSGNGLYAATSSTSTSAYGVNAYAYSGNAVNGITDGPAGYGVYGQSTGGIGVFGQDRGSGNGVYAASSSGYGIYAYSNSSYAGYFDGPIAATSYNTVSDKNAKTDFRPVDRREILERVDRLAVTSWNFKTDLKKRHLGPMAQDFHAAFGLNGDDETHINLADIAGVSLAAIQALNSEMQEKDALLKAQQQDVSQLREQLQQQGRELADLKQMNLSMQAAMEKLFARDQRVAMRN